MKNLAIYFTSTHHNQIGLFVEPEIDVNFRAVDSINYSFSNLYVPELINPNNNPHLNFYFRDFFFDYIFEKQNIDGSYSDIAGLGNMFSTYEALESLNLMDPLYLDEKISSGETENIADYLVSSLNGGGWGFKFNQLLNDSDIISTFCAIKSAYNIAKGNLLTNQKIREFINSTWTPVIGSYRITNDSLIATPETTYYGVKAFLEMNMSYSLAEILNIGSYFSSHYNLIDGGYINPETGMSDVQTTYYCLSTLNLLGLDLFINEDETLNFVLNCSNNNGGFGIRPNASNSDFKSGWAALKSIDILKKLVVLTDQKASNIVQISMRYYRWLHFFQARNGLFGQITLESNYFGMLTYYNMGYLDSTDSPEIQFIKNSILNFTIACYNFMEGGFGSRPGQNSTLFSTYCGLNLLQMIIPMYRPWLPPYFLNLTKNYLANLQNPDGGFRIGNDVDYVLSLFGAYSIIFTDLINTNMSTIESTYWALMSLRLINGLERISYNNLTHWVRSCQNADGGFSIIIGFHSDIISTYYGLQMFTEGFFNGPMSKISVIEFLKQSQNSDGSFSLIPMMGQFLELPSSFLTTYMASKSLYDYNYQPEDIQGALLWFADCI
ncbi:MAG: prenyltransferase/squalene oxidase repeat-containing protein, partial [Promethearchaeota archaeon]